MKKNEQMSEDQKPPTFRSGFVSLVGRPNVGKSTLLNQAVGDVVAITTNLPQTTRTRIRGIVHRPHGQIVFLDTPGMHLAPGESMSEHQRQAQMPGKTRALNKYMVAEARAALSEVDINVLLVEATGRGRRPDHDPEDRMVTDAIRQSGRPTLLAINKIDLLAQKELLLPIIQAYQETGLFEEIFPISALQDKGVDRLLDAIDSRLPEGPRYFPEDMMTDQPEKQIVAEFIREQVILQTGDEIPFSTAVEILSFEDLPERKLVRIYAVIHIERKSQKGILIGKQGQRLKSIGSQARKSIERMLACRVYLDLRVKVKAGWSRSSAGLRSVGYEKK